MSVLRINWHRKHGLYSIYFVTPIVGYGPALVDCRESGLLMPLLYSAAKGRPCVGGRRPCCETGTANESTALRFYGSVQLAV